MLLILKKVESNPLEFQIEDWHRVYQILVQRDSIPFEDLLCQFEDCQLILLFHRHGNQNDFEDFQDHFASFESSYSRQYQNLQAVRS